MGKQTTISWTDHTWNPWLGCTHVHPGCDHCYAESSFVTRMKGVEWGPEGTRIVTTEKYWYQPRRWDREATKTAVQQKVFCASLADVFEDWRGQLLDHNGAILGWDDDYLIRTIYEPGENSLLTLTDLRTELMELIDDTQWLIWQVLTKRPENIPRMIHGRKKKRGNLWLGTSVSDQASAELLLDHLVVCKDLCHRLFVSVEPLLGPVDLEKWLPSLDLVIIGGESGFQARECNIQWIYDLVEQCQRSGVAVFVKQLGAKPISYRSDFPLNVQDKKGGNPDEWPPFLRVQQMPEAA